MIISIDQERVRVEASRVGSAVAGKLEERARREEDSRREVTLCVLIFLYACPPACGNCWSGLRNVAI